VETLIKKIIVVGTTGSGKSTFSKQLADKLNYPHIQIDQLHWKANWQESTDHELFEKLKNATASEQWIVDGNYNRTNHLTWPYADTVIWINPPFIINLYQSVSRALKRILSQEERWEGTGNRESLKMLFSKDSIVWWMLKTYRGNIKRYEKRFKETQYSHIKFYRLRSRKEIKKFLRNFI
jgi:adenylate kinase family enzyme